MALALPAALVFREAEDILTLGAMIAEQLFDTPIAVLRLPPDDFKRLSNAQYASILDNTLKFNGHSIALSQLSVDRNNWQTPM